MSEEKEQNADLFAATELPKLVDQIAVRFGITQEEALNTLLCTVLTLGQELAEDEPPLAEEPLAAMVHLSNLFRDDVDDTTEH